MPWQKMILTLFADYRRQTLRGFLGNLYFCVRKLGRKDKSKGLFGSLGPTALYIIYKFFKRA